MLFKCKKLLFILLFITDSTVFAGSEYLAGSTKINMADGRLLPIKSITILDMVSTHSNLTLANRNQESHSYDDHAQIDSTWQQVDLEYFDNQGNKTAEVLIVRPITWLMKRGIKPENIGKMIKEELDLPKSLIGHPTLKSISPILTTIGNTQRKKPVIGIFKYYLKSNDSMVHYNFQESQPTAQQSSIIPDNKDSITADNSVRFYDNTTQIFIAIEEYNANQSTTFLSKTKQTFHIKTVDAQQVKSDYAYMIEVWKDHCFYIGPLALLVHNPDPEEIQRMQEEAIHAAQQAAWEKMQAELEKQQKEEAERKAEEERKEKERKEEEERKEREELQHLRMTGGDLGRIEELIDKHETPSGYWSK